MHLILMLGFVLLETAGQATVDYDTIDKRLTKEPAYQGKPQYCLLVFGPEAKTKVWLVIDGDIAYLDRNANGDLTEAGESLEIKRGTDQARRGKLGTIPSTDGKETFRLLYLDNLYLIIEVREGFEQYATLSFAARPLEAPVFPFGGPLGLFVLEDDLKRGLGQGDPAQQVSVMFGTRVVDKSGKPVSGVAALRDPKHPWAAVQAPSRGFPKDLSPVAEIEFPARRKGDPPVKKSYTLDLRC